MSRRLRAGPDRAGRDRSFVYVPTEEQIKTAAAKIREAWSPRAFRVRSGGADRKAEGVSLPEYRLSNVVGPHYSVSDFF